MMRGERSYLRQRGLRRKTVFPLSCPTEGVVVINMKNILRQKVSAGIFGASLLGSLFFGGAAQAADDLTVLTSFGIIEEKFKEGKVPIPTFWGGYRVRFDSVEFWQGRPSRLHDRFIYEKNAEGGWDISRLAP